MTQQSERLVFVGTYTRGESKGIYVCRLDTTTGRLTVVDTASGITNPSFLALHPSRRYLYAVSEVSDSDGRPTGGVSAFSVDPESGRLTLVNQQESGGTGPCHVNVDKTGRYVLVANYAGGSVAILPVQDGGKLGRASDFVQHEGASRANPDRQDRPHAHSINLDPANRHAYVADLGLDRIMIYNLDLENGKLPPSDPPWTQVHPGAGPRHFSFHPNGRYAYVINELDSTLTALSYDQVTGALTVGQTVSTLPDGFTGNNTTADVHVHPSGRFAYGSNRGHDSIAIFAVNEGANTLTPIGHESTQGRVPRNFALDPTGTFLLAANQDTGNIVSFRVDQQSGGLTATGDQVEVPFAVCIKMLPDR